MISQAEKDVFDVAIVGGGPGGAWTAKECAERGLHTVLLEKDPDLGSPVRCAEGVGVMGLKEFYEPDPAFVRRTINQYRLISPNGTEVNISGGDFGYVLDRKVFDKRIGEDAAAAGAKIITNAFVGGAHRDGELYVLEVEGMADISAKLIIGADGTESRVGRWWSLRTETRPHDMESAAQYLLGNLDIDEDVCQLWFGSKVAPGGYFWVFPKGNRTANVGLGISGEYAGTHNPFKYLDRLISEQFPDASRIGRTMGGIPCSGEIKQYYADGLMLVGDAAHQANPITGGGIINAMKAGRIAADVAAEAIKKQDTSAKVLERYQREWDKLLGKSHRRFYKVKEAVFHMSDEKFDAIAESVNSLPHDKRTLPQVFKAAVINQPSLLLDVARLVF